MATTTPKYDEIVKIFAEKIKDPVTFSGTTFDVIPGKVVKTKAAIESYINEGMFRLLNKIWVDTQGNLEIVAGVLPELMRYVSGLALSNPASNYDIGANYPNFWRLVNANADDKSCSIQPGANLTLLLADFVGQYTGNASNPVACEVNKILYVFPITDFAGKGLKILYLSAPLKSDGTRLTQNGGTDSPFFDHWNETIAELAAQSFRESAVL